jgi:hypothetical protein
MGDFRESFLFELLEIWADLLISHPLLFVVVVLLGGVIGGVAVKWGLKAAYWTIGGELALAYVVGAVVAALFGGSVIEVFVMPIVLFMAPWPWVILWASLAFIGLIVGPIVRRRLGKQGR